MKCPYNDLECISDINTSGMAGDINCAECDHYDKGIRPTGALPDINLKWIGEIIRKIKQKLKK